MLCILYYIYIYMYIYINNIYVSIYIYIHQGETVKTDLNSFIKLKIFPRVTRIIAGKIKLLNCLLENNVNTRTNLSPVIRVLLLSAFSKSSHSFCFDVAYIFLVGITLPYLPYVHLIRLLF